MPQSGGKTSNDTSMYDQLAPQYRNYSERKSRYLEAIDNLVIATIPKGAGSLLDVGAGDGVRAVKIAHQCNIARIVLSEPSHSMIELCKKLPGTEIWQSAAEDISQTDETFDVILCLWNVLGHIGSNERRIIALKKMSDHLSYKGRLFIDVNNRYNARSYGYISTLKRWLHDYVHPAENNGDVTFEWSIGDRKIPAMGHFFTPREMDRLINAGNLKIVKRYVVDYASGELGHTVFSGQLFYELTGVKSP